MDPTSDVARKDLMVSASMHVCAVVVSFRYTLNAMLPLQLALTAHPPSFKINGRCDDWVFRPNWFHARNISVLNITDGAMQAFGPFFYFFQLFGPLNFNTQDKRMPMCWKATAAGIRFGSLRSRSFRCRFQKAVSLRAIDMEFRSATAKCMRHAS